MLPASVVDGPSYGQGEGARTETWARAFAFIISSYEGSRSVHTLMSFVNDLWSNGRCPVVSAQQPVRRRPRTQTKRTKAEVSRSGGRNKIKDVL